MPGSFRPPPPSERGRAGIICPLAGSGRANDAMVGNIFPSLFFLFSLYLWSFLTSRNFECLYDVIILSFFGGSGFICLEQASLGSDF